MFILKQFPTTYNNSTLYEFQVLTFILNKNIKHRSCKKWCQNELYTKKEAATLPEYSLNI